MKKIAVIALALAVGMAEFASLQRWRLKAWTDAAATRRRPTGSYRS